MIEQLKERNFAFAVAALLPPFPSATTVTTKFPLA